MNGAIVYYADYDGFSSGIWNCKWEWFFDTASFPETPNENWWMIPLWEVFVEASE